MPSCIYLTIVHLLYNALTHWHSFQIFHDLAFQKKNFITRRILSYLIGLQVKLTCLKMPLCIYSTMHWHIWHSFQIFHDLTFQKKSFITRRILSYLIGLQLKLNCFKMPSCIYSTMHWHIYTQDSISRWFGVWNCSVEASITDCVEDIFCLITVSFLKKLLY